MQKTIIVKIAIIVMSLLIVKPVVAADSKTIKDDGKILQPLCIVRFVCPPIGPIDPVMPDITR